LVSALKTAEEQPNTAGAADNAGGPASSKAAQMAAGRTDRRVKWANATSGSPPADGQQTEPAAGTEPPPQASPAAPTQGPVQPSAPAPAPVAGPQPR
jgi:hypothetical protein